MSEAGPGEGEQQQLVPMCVLTDKFEGQTPYTNAEQCYSGEYNLVSITVDDEVLRRDCTGCDGGVDLLPLLFLHKRSGKVVLERSEVGKSCLRFYATSFAESAKKRARHLLSGTLTFQSYGVHDPIKPVHGK